MLLDARVGFSASASNVIGAGADAAVVGERRICRAVEHAPDRHLHLLADELRRAGDDDLVAAVELADAGGRVVEADLDELQLERGALLDGRIRPHRVELALPQHLEVIEMDVAVARRGHEEEPPACGRFELLEPASARAGEEREHARVHRDLERLDAGALGDRTQLALDLERVRRVGDDDSVARRRPGSGS